MDVYDITLQSITNNLHELKIISTNVANVNTPGYLKGQSFPQKLSGSVTLSEVINSQNGPVKETKRALDVAIQGQGFFQISQHSKIYLTRDGRFFINKDSLLSHSSGGVVYGENGPITAIANQTTIKTNGDVIVQGRQVDKIVIVNVEQPSKLIRQGNNLFLSEQPIIPLNKYALKTGALNSSNVESSAEMVRMIEVSRQLQTSQKVVNAYDQLLNVGINELGKK